MMHRCIINKWIEVEQWESNIVVNVSGFVSLVTRLHKSSRPRSNAEGGGIQELVWGGG